MPPLFVKNFVGLTVNQVYEIYAHGIQIYDLLHGAECKSVRPLVVRGLSITYEYLDIQYSLASLLISGEILSSEFRILGVAAAQIHKGSGYTKQHGDLVAHNIVFVAGSLTLIDADVPENVRRIYNTTQGQGDLDYWALISSVAECVGFRKLPERIWYLLNSVASFQEAYFKSGGLRHGFSSMLKFIHFSFRLRRRSGFGLLSSLIHSAGIYFWLIICLIQSVYVYENI